MATRFFENQAAARRNTKWLVVLFGLAVVALAAMLYALAVVLTGIQQPEASGREVEIALQWWQPDLLVTVGLAICCVIAIACVVLHRRSSQTDSMK